MKKEFTDFNTTMHQHWVDFVNKIPEIILAITILLFGLFVIKFTSKYSKKIIEQRANDSIVTKFLVNMITIVLAIILTSICLGILGFGNVTDKLLAGTAITTFIANQNMIYRSDLVAKLDVNRLQVQQRIAALKANFIAKGMTPDQALASAYKILDFSVMKQATVLSYMDVFLYLGIMFLICIPFILFIKERKGGRTIDPSEAMH